MKTRHQVFGLLLALVLAAAESAAQTYPSKPVKIVVGYGAGGGTDVNMRLLVPKLSERLGQPVIVENKPGAAARIGAEFVAKSVPDGYTLYAGSSGEMVANVGLFPELSYNPGKDFVPITLFNYDPMVFTVNPGVPVKTIKELISLAKGKPGQVFHASAASAFQVAVEVFNREVGVKIVHVPYKGAAPAMTAAISGEATMIVLSPGPLMVHVKSGKLRTLAISAAKRSPFLPDVPTFRESGLDFETPISWAGLFAPAGTPEEIIEKLYQGMTFALRDKGVLDRLHAMGRDTSTTGVSPAEFARILQEDLAKWPKAIRELGIRGG
ncbi:MAG: tripartite tricarboxylate transporter substrate binding protein [Betaproteobacteria bacterium]|nr:tripartite tricarboxylate transporter substrate binding protein [Betaproteobacteria bacterium]